MKTSKTIKLIRSLKACEMKIRLLEVRLGQGILLTKGIHTISKLKEFENSRRGRRSDKFLSLTQTK
jgi:hypothetical protein